MSRYYIGDLHLGHAKLAELRGFDTIFGVVNIVAGRLPHDEVCGG